MSRLKPLCIYHGGCSDGFAAAWVVQQALGSNVEFFAARYQTPPPDVTGRTVYIVDFSYKASVMDEMALKADQITVIDHHKTAEAELEELLATQAIDGIFDMSKSGAMLTWEWFFPASEPPELIAHVQDRDLWKFELEGTREICAALYSYPMEFEVWDHLMSLPVSVLHKEGVAIERAHMKNVKSLIRTCQTRMVLDGHDVPVANAPYFMASDVGNLMAEGEPFSVSYFDLPDGRRKYSLRAKEDGVDVSVIAAKFGGGGHKCAAGFELKITHDLSAILADPVIGTLHA